MRGVVTLAAALSLPAEVAGRDFVLLCSFAVILVTVLLQGTTLGPLIKLLRLTKLGEWKVRQDSEDSAWRRMTEAQLEAIERLSRQPDGTGRHPRLLEQFRHRARVAAQFITDRDVHLPQKVEHFNAVIVAIKAGRAEILRLHGSGEIHDRVLRDLENELDLQELVAESHAG